MDDQIAHFLQAFLVFVFVACSMTVKLVEFTQWMGNPSSEQSEPASV